MHSPILNVRGLRVGIVVAADVPEEEYARMMDRKLAPVTLKFRNVENRQEFEVPVRDLTPIEVCMVVQRAIEEQKIEFGFRPRPGAGIVGPGGM